MNRKNLISLIILDIFVMLLAIGLFIFRYNSIMRSAAVTLPPMTFRVERAPVQTETARQQPEQDTAIDTPIDDTVSAAYTRDTEEKRNIAFVYRTSKARKVAIMGDFNDWSPQPLKKGKDFKWTVSLKLVPGEYAYNFVVDGKPVRDPNNPKACNAGRGFPNSFLKVKPR